MSPHRIQVVADGFNLYHSICDALKEIRAANAVNAKFGNPLNSEQMRWLDLKAVCTSYLSAIRQSVGTVVELGDIHYYSAFARHRGKDNVERHMDYVSALTLSGVRVELSRFKRKDFECRHCNKGFALHFEKETDVAVASKVIELAATNACDTIFLLSGDTDLLPSLRTVRRIRPETRLAIAFPYQRDSAELKALADVTFQLDTKKYRKHQLPDPMILPNGDPLPRPTSW